MEETQYKGFKFTFYSFKDQKENLKENFEEKTRNPRPPVHPQLRHSSVLMNDAFKKRLLLNLNPALSKKPLTQHNIRLPRRKDKITKSKSSECMLENVFQKLKPHPKSARLKQLAPVVHKYKKNPPNTLPPIVCKSYSVPRSVN